MKEYIEKQSLLKEIEENIPLSLTNTDVEKQSISDYKDFYNIVKKHPVSDVIKVIRCKDCKYYDTKYRKDNYGLCKLGYGLRTANRFCDEGRNKKRKGIN